jgi:hypothetical protein
MVTIVNIVNMQDFCECTLLQCVCVFHCVTSCIVGNNQICLQYWQLIDRIIQQVALQTKDGNPDNAPLEIDIKKLVKQYVY